MTFPCKLQLLLIALSNTPVPAQSDPQVPFDAASIKPSRPGDARRPTMEFLPGGRFRSTNMPLLAILATAYNVPWQSVETLRIKGVPDWVLAEKYDIEATAPITGATAKARNEKIRQMLQSVLADRLKLKMRREITEMPIYSVTVRVHGPKLEKAKIDDSHCTEICHQFQGGAGRGIHGTAVDMADLALYVSNWTDAPVVDQTGLTGLYAIQTEGWSRTPDDDPSRPSLSSIFDQFGLKLTRGKGPVEIFVIEHIEKPTEN